MSRNIIAVCPWQKVTESYWTKVHQYTDKNTITELFGECYGEKCPFFDAFSESCQAIKTLTTMQR